MTEWELQQRLTRRWLVEGRVVLAGEVFFLAAWEVMEDYRINDYRRHWAMPSIDFLLLDESGHLAALELKRAITSPREAWSALCQVSHRAAVLATHYRPELLVGAYRDCYSGTDGRAPVADSVPDLTAAHGRLFEMTPLAALPGVPVRRLLMAESFGRSVTAVYDVFSRGLQAEIRTHVEGYRGRSTEFRRYLGCDLDPTKVATDAVVLVDTAGDPWFFKDSVSG